MLWLKENRIRVSKIAKTGEKYATLFASSSSKKKDSNEYEYSNWTVTLLGKARQMLDMVQEGAVLTLTQSFLTNLPYEKGDGTKVWTNPKLVVLDFEVYRAGTGGEEPVVPEDDDIPF